MIQTVTFFLAEQMLATSLALPLEQLRAAESMAKTAKKKHGKALKIQLASIDGLPIKTHTGLTLQADCAIADIALSDLTFLPALWRNPSRTLKKNTSIKPWLIQQHESGGIIAGVGTGCCFLAEAGLLDNRIATTHWYYFDQFAKHYPKVKLARNHFVTGQDNLYCAASVNALAELTILFIQDIFGNYFARHVERHFFHEVRQPHSFSIQNQGELQSHPDEQIAEAQSWIQQHFNSPLQITDIANKLEMSLRNFNRRFKQATNKTPKEYLQTIRMTAAGELLKTSNLSLAEIAEQVGYQDQAHFSSLFKQHFSTTPGQYRTTVRRKLFTPE